MDVLVSVGTAAIYLYSLGMVLAGGGHEAVYFEAGVMVVAFVSLGKYLEERTKRGSLNSLGLLLRLTPAETEVRTADGTWHLQPLSAVKAGDVLRCTDGGRIAADGVVLAGEAWADESHLTGESEPQRKTAGSRVLAGALLSGSVEYRAEALGGDTLLGDMMRALSEAQGSKAPIARLADKVAAVFVPVVLALALLMLPMVLRSTEEMLKLVPDSLREGSYALGVPKWKTILRIVVPTSYSGILTGVVLGIARVMGETAPLLILIGYTQNLFLDPFGNSMGALPTMINSGISVPEGQPGADRVWAAALTLVLIVMVLNLIARRIASRNKLT